MQTYRRGAAFLCMLCLMFCTCIVTAAQEPYDCFERLENYPADLAQIQALDYLTPINGAIEVMGQTPLPEDTVMDFSSAIRVYDCPTLFSANTDSKAAVVSQLQNSSPMYLYAFTHRQRVYYLTFSIGKPVWEPARDVMTSSEISEVEQNEGKWILDTVGTSDQDYIAVNALGELESRLQTLDLQDTVYLVHDALGYETVVALIPNNQHIQMLTPVFGAQEALQQMEASQPQTRVNQQLPEGFYAFDEVMAYYRQHASTSDSYGGAWVGNTTGQEDAWIPLVVSGGCAAALVLFLGGFYLLNRRYL